MSSCTGASTSSNTAEQIADSMKKSIPEVLNVIYIDEKNDPNHQIGQPNGYTSAAVLQDIRYFNQGDEIGVANGATIEVFENENLAKKREDHIALAGEVMPMFKQHVYRRGKVLLRCDTPMNNADFEKYKEAFDKSLS